jgi:hypothetical protein
MTAPLTPGRPFTGTERQLLEDTLRLHRSEGGAPRSTE